MFLYKLSKLFSFLQLSYTLTVYAYFRLENAGNVHLTVEIFMYQSFVLEH